MTAEQLMRRASATYRADAMRVIAKAFDAAWKSIASEVGTDPKRIEIARLNLATAILERARENCKDAEVLKNAALYTVVRDARKR